MAEYRIGIDLGTTNCALAWVRTSDTSGTPEIFPLPQQSGEGTFVESPLLPSFLAMLPGEKNWRAGWHARSLAPELPGRVISSAKSWLVHHVVDRRAPFLPLGKEEIAPDQKLSPVQASQALLQHLRTSWDQAHPEAPLNRQEVAVTVPASFDPVAQQLTLDAVHAAGFPSATLLLEEPQAAFYGRPEEAAPAVATDSAEEHILVADIGGGTSDFSLFRLAANGQLQRLAVGEHILLGGDNLDLALAHALENKLSPDKPLPAPALSRLVGRAREIKEEFFGEAEVAVEKNWPVALALPGASLLKGTLRTEVSAAELEPLLLEGFFPRVGKRETPLSQPGGLREMGLPYAKDPAITRHLAAFLRDRPTISAVFFNGGTTKSAFLRRRILDLIGSWQDGATPREWPNPQPDCAVALGAARFLYLRSCGRAMEAGAARACYLGVGKSSALCILPLGTPPDEPVEANPDGLRATLGQPASFPLYQHSRRPDDRPGDVIPLDDNFHLLPSLETILLPPKNGRKARQPEVRVGVRTSLRSTGVLEVGLVCREHSLKWKDPWRLDFVIRDSIAAGQTSQLRSLPPETIRRTAEKIRDTLLRAERTRPTGNHLLVLVEKECGQSRHDLGAGAVRALLDALLEPPLALPDAAREAWCQLSSFLLRPGRGVPGDETRLEKLLPAFLPLPAGTPKALRLQQWVALRRVASGLTPAQTATVWKSCETGWTTGKVPPTELLLLAGSLDALAPAIRSSICRDLCGYLRQAPDNVMLWRSLGSLLSRFLFHAGADQVLPPDRVDEAWQSTGSLEVPGAARKEAASCWLRAARRTGLREVDVEAGTRKAIDRLLRSWGVDEVRRRVLHEVVPLAEADQSRLLGEAPPPGLHFQESA